jgi:hypothetical protein
MYLQAGSTNNAIDVFNAAGTTQLFKLTGTGAATFSSSVTAGGDVSITKDNPKLILNDNAGGSQNNYSISSNFGFFNLNDETASGASVFSYGGGLFNFTGAATFSSSVTSTQGIIRGDLGTSVEASLRLRGSNSTARTTRLQFEDYAGAYADGLIDFKIPTAGSATGARLDIGVDSAIMSLVRGGNVGIGTTTPGSKLSIVGLPTSSSGLSSGDIWNDGGTLKIV